MTADSMPILELTQGLDLSAQSDYDVYDFQRCKKIVNVNEFATFIDNHSSFMRLTKLFTPPVYAEVQKAVDDGETCAEVQTFCESRGAVQRCATMRQAVRKECAA